MDNSVLTSNARLGTHTLQSKGSTSRTLTPLVPKFTTSHGRFDPNGVLITDGKECGTANMDRVATIYRSSKNPGNTSLDEIGGNVGTAAVYRGSLLWMKFLCKEEEAPI